MGQRHDGAWRKTGSMLLVLPACRLLIYAPPPSPQVVAVEQLLGFDCDEAAEEHRLAEIEAREKRDQGNSPANGGGDLVAYYEQLEATVKHE